MSRFALSALPFRTSKTSNRNLGSLKFTGVGSKAARHSRARKLVAESLERRNLLATIQIFAAGQVNEERMELRIDGQTVQAWENIGGDARARNFLTFSHSAPGVIRPEQIQVAFTNDLHLPEIGFDRNIRVDAIAIDGRRYEAEAPSVFSNATWLPADGIAPGFRESEWLHSNGYFEFAPDVSDGSLITVRAAGDEGLELFELRIDNQTVGTYAVTTEYQNFVYVADGVVDPSQVRVVFINDFIDRSQGIDYNLDVDFISIDDTIYQTEAPTVFSTGTWLPHDGIRPGFRGSQELHGAGYFQFGQAPSPGSFSLESSVLTVPESAGSASVTVLRSGGSDGRITLDYATVNVTAESGSDYSARSGTLVFQDGETQKVINIPILEDGLLEGDEQFAFTVDNISGGGSLLVPRTATITIDDNDSVQAAGDGLLGEYFDALGFANRFLNRVDTAVNFDWGTGSPASGMGVDDFSVRWSGQIEPRYSELYTFETRTDDGVRLWVNNQLIIDQWVNQAVTSHTGTITLEGGRLYDIRMEYYERGGLAAAQLLWSSPQQTRQIVPRSQLYAADAPPPEPGSNLQTQTIVTGLTRPTTIDFSPDGNLIYVGEQRGIIRVLENGVLQTAPFLDFRDRINGTRDRGLLDIAVHPQFPANPYIYLIYTYDPPQVNQQAAGTLAGPDGNGNRAGRVTRVTADAASNYTTVVPGSEIVLVGSNSTWDNFNGFANSTSNFSEPPAGILPDGSNLADFIATDSESHTVGALEFGLDGSLFISIGDGTSYNRVDPRTVRVQDIDNLSGKILRIDPDTGRGLTSNPFYRGDLDENRAKVYQMGLRNPFRTTVHPTTGQLYIGDVGWTQWEEVNRGAAGANFGWPYFEGGNGNSLRTNGYRDLPEAIAFYSSGQTVIAPTYALNHAQSGINAIVVGDFLTSPQVPAAFQGDLLVNDLGQGIVRNVSFDANGSVTAVGTFATGANVVVQIKQSPDGGMYFVDLDDGRIGRWVFTPSGASAAAAPTELAPEILSPPQGDASGVTIALVDSGFDGSASSANLWTNQGEIPGDGIDNDLNGYIDDVHGYDFLSDAGNLQDSDGHGTFMADLLTGPNGIATGADLMPLRALGGSEAETAQAIRYAVDQAADVIVLAWTSEPSRAILEAIEYAAANDILVVAAAGNQQADAPEFPARLSAELPNVLSAGGLSVDGTAWTATNAAGQLGAVQIDALGVSTRTVGGESRTYQGTSVSTTVLAGVAAMTLRAGPHLRGSQVRDVLVQSANPVASGSTSLGSLNADFAVQSAAALNDIQFRDYGDRVVIIGTSATEDFRVNYSNGEMEINGVTFPLPDTPRLDIRAGDGQDRLHVYGSDADEDALLRSQFLRAASNEHLFYGLQFEHVSLFGGGGNDEMNLQGTSGVDQVLYQPGAIEVFSDNAESLAVMDVGNIALRGGGGADYIEMKGTDAADVFQVWPTAARLTTENHRLHAMQFEHVVADLGEGSDTGTIRGSGADESLTMYADSAVWTTPKTLVEVSSIENLTTRGLGGQDSLAIFSPPTDDRFVHEPGSAFWKVDTFTHRFANFEDVDFYGNGTDQVVLKSDGNEMVATASSTHTQVVLGTNVVDTWNTPEIYLRSDSTNDSVTFNGSEQEELYVSGTIATRFESESFFVHAMNFETKVANGGPEDIASIGDTENDDVLTLDGDTANLTSINYGDTVVGFGRVYAYSSPDASFDQILELSPPQFEFTANGSWEGGNWSGFSGGSGEGGTGNWRRYPGGLSEAELQALLSLLDNNFANDPQDEVELWDETVRAIADQRMDTNADGQLSPIDVLLIVNHLNARKEDATAPYQFESAAEAQLDINGDGWITPLDALQIINRLNG